MAHASEEFQRRQVTYRGRVQGVGFRYTTQRIAQRFAVTGYVCNMVDGGVSLVAEGEVSELDAFLAVVAGQMEGHIRSVDQIVLPITGEFRGFDIRYQYCD